MDPLMLGNALMLLGAFSVQFGLIDGSDLPGFLGGGGNDEDAPEPGSGPGTEPDTEIYTDTGNIITGTEGADSLDGTDEPGSIEYFMLGGDDTLTATMGDDVVDLGAGDDSAMLKPGDDLATGGEGDDSIDGGFGNDTISGGAGDDVISGAKDDDMLLGEEGDDTLSGSHGADSLSGGAGNDLLYGFLSGQPGAPDDGADTLDGGEGDDLLHVAAGDIAIGGAGADQFNLYAPDGAEPVPLAEIEDFTAGEDVVGVFYTPQIDPATGLPQDPDISIGSAPDGAGVVVSLDGVEVATVKGDVALTLADIVLIPATPT